MQQVNKHLHDDQLLSKKVESEMRHQGKVLISEIDLHTNFHFHPDGFTWTLVGYDYALNKYKVHTNIDSTIRQIGDFWVFEGDSTPKERGQNV